MPTIIKNMLEIDATPELTSTIRCRIAGVDENGEFAPIRFQSIIPMPAELDIECDDEGYQLYAAFAEKYIADHPDCDILSVDVSDEAAFCAMNFAQLDQQAAAEQAERWAMGKRAYRNEKLYGVKDGYQWRLQNWGTNWDAEYAWNGKDQRINFRTANEPAAPIAKRISEMYPEATITLSYYDTGEWLGVFVFRGGEEVEQSVMFEEPCMF